MPELVLLTLTLTLTLTITLNLTLTLSLSLTLALTLTLAVNSGAGELTDKYLKTNNSTSRQVNHYEIAVTTSMLPGQQCVGNSAYLLT